MEEGGGGAGQGLDLVTLASLSANLVTLASLSANLGTIFTDHLKDHLFLSHLFKPGKDVRV